MAVHMEPERVLSLSLTLKTTLVLDYGRKVVLSVSERLREYISE